MPRRVRIVAQAESDLRAVADVIRRRVSAESARRWVGLLRAAVYDLADSAAVHPEADEADLLGHDLRMRIVGKRPHVYRILYTYTPDVVIVHRVRHAAQDYLTEGEL